MKTHLFLSGLLLWAGVLVAQAPAAEKKQLQAMSTSEAIDIDGILSESAWKQAAPAQDFITLEPNPGLPPGQRSEVKVLYDNSGIYIGAMCWDGQPDGIQRELSQRDNMGNTDWFGVFIDAYRDGINGVGFLVTAAGVQIDIKYSALGEDGSWDAVWESAVSATPEGWICEIKIPYAAIRFPKLDEQVWHINFARHIRRVQELSVWDPIDPAIDGLFNQSGLLSGIKGIKPPFRLQATPYVAAYAENFHDKNAAQVNSFGRSFNGGMDIKYGINDAFTLDMTLIPDFGEAQSDNQVLNLSPFEVRFDENRQFFTEGTELFNKGGLFYSRRIGGRPLHYNRPFQALNEGEKIVSNPQQAQLYNASKVSGRNSKGLGLGFFNATAGRMTAQIENEAGDIREVETNPLTNYNVLVLDQNLKNNSYVTLINTTVLRDGQDYDANVSGAVFELRNNQNKYSLSGSGKLSQLYHPDSTALGHAYFMRMAKISGNFNFELSYNVESNRYNPNDLGFLLNNNERSAELEASYAAFKPFWKFNRGRIGFSTRYERLFQPDVFSELGANLWAWGQLKNFWEANVWAFYQPRSYDYFEARQAGRVFNNPSLQHAGFWMGTDGRKRLRLSLNGEYTSFREDGRRSWEMSFEPRFRVNDKLNFSWEFSNSFSKRNPGFVNNRTVQGVDPVTGEPEERQEIVFGYRDIVNLENLLAANYTFTPNMGLNFRLRHNWTKVDYESFHTLNTDGSLAPNDYAGNHNANFNAFNIDMIYRWRFAPGSDLFFIWKNSILDIENELANSYFDNLNGLFQQPQRNSFSLKVIYFLDYSSLMRQKG